MTVLWQGEWAEANGYRFNLRPLVRATGVALHIHRYPAPTLHHQHMTQARAEQWVEAFVQEGPPQWQQTPLGYTATCRGARLTVLSVYKGGYTGLVESTMSAVVAQRWFSEHVGRVWAETEARVLAADSLVGRSLVLRRRG